MEWMIMPLKRYAAFQGRSRRREFWMFSLFKSLALILMFSTGMMLNEFGVNDDAFGLVLGAVLIFSLGMFIPTLAVTVRRLHDQNKSGWLALLLFFPGIGDVIMLIFMCIQGTAGPNRFGSDPKGTDSEVFE